MSEIGRRDGREANSEHERDRSQETSEVRVSGFEHPRGPGRDRGAGRSPGKDRHFQEAEHDVPIPGTARMSGDPTTHAPRPPGPAAEPVKASPPVSAPEKT